MLVIKTARQSCKGRTYAARDLAFTAHLPYTAGPGIPGLYTCYPLGQSALTDLRYFIYGRFVSGPALEGLS